MFHEIVSSTSRPMRDYEVEGINYHFLSKAEFLEKIENGHMLEHTKFNGWYYGTSLNSLRENKINIGVFNPAGIYSLLKREDIELTVYYIDACPKLRLLRQLNREDEPNVDEIVRRYNTDNLDFLSLAFDYEKLVNEKEEDLRLCALHILDKTR